MAYKDEKKKLAYINEYQQRNYDRITVMASKGKKQEWQTPAKIKGVSLSAFIMDCVEKEIERMKG